MSELMERMSDVVRMSSTSTPKDLNFLDHRWHYACRGEGSDV